MQWITPRAWRALHLGVNSNRVPFLYLTVKWAFETQKGNCHDCWIPLRLPSCCKMWKPDPKNSLVEIGLQTSQLEKLRMLTWSEVKNSSPHLSPVIPIFQHFGCIDKDCHCTFNSHVLETKENENQKALGNSSSGGTEIWIQPHKAAWWRLIQALRMLWVVYKLQLWKWNQILLMCFPQ